jgi:hypothetical protein
MPTTYSINQAGLLPVAGEAQPAGKGAADDGDLTLSAQRQRKIELAHEASLLNKAGRIPELRHCLETLLELDPSAFRPYTIWDC